jgi:type IV pilus assembly protein PilA
MFSSAIQRLNDRRDGAGDAGDDAGFTLIELMVVLLILAILLAIAIPTFLGVTKSANDRATQSNLNTALVNAKSAFQTNSQSYAYTTTGTANQTANASSLVSTLNSAEPSLAFQTGAVPGATSTTGASIGQAAVSVQVSSDGNGLVLAEQSKSTNNCFFVIDNTQQAATTTGNLPWTNSGFPNTAGTWYGEAKNASVCNAAAAPAASSTVVYQSNGFPSL